MISHHTKPNYPRRRHPAAAAALVILASLGPGDADADVSLPGVFSHNMVIQRGRPVPVWGIALPGEHITVTFSGASAGATAAADGRWRATLSKQSANAKPQTLRVEGTNTVEFHNVLVGEVWLCAGQSNMAWPVAKVQDAETELREAERWGRIGQIRIFRAPLAASPHPTESIGSYWKVATPDNIREFSAVAYFFGREIHTTHDQFIPVGLIQTAWGGTRIEAWTSRNALEASFVARPVLEAWNDADQRWDPEWADSEYRRRLFVWEEKTKRANEETGETGEPRAPRKPAPPSPPLESRHRPTALFNAMVHPIIPYAIRGALWYQGESNAGRAVQYRDLFPLMIRDWRSRWGQGDFPFYFVQLANFRAPVDGPGQTSAWAELQEAQRLALALPNTGMAVTNDIGSADDIHPKNKQDVGKRLARWAFHRDYGFPDELPGGPLFSGSTREEGGQVRVRFKYAQGLKSSDGAPLRRFEVAGENRKWVWAEARIEGDTVVVSSPDVPAPRAVRYAWSSNPEGANLTNKTGLPASVFRTDEWPLWTEERVDPLIEYIR